MRIEEPTIDWIDKVSVLEIIEKGFYKKHPSETPQQQAERIYLRLFEGDFLK